MKSPTRIFVPAILLLVLADIFLLFREISIQYTIIALLSGICIVSGIVILILTMRIHRQTSTVSQDTLLKPMPEADLSHLQQLIANSDLRYQRLLECLNEGVVVTDSDRRIAFTNGALIRMLGYRADEIIGRDISQFADISVIQQAVEEYRKNPGMRFPSFTVTLNRHDHREIRALVEVGVIADDAGNFCGAIAGLMDITEHFVIMDQLERHRRRLAAVLDHIPHYIYAHNVAGRIILANQAFAHAFENTPEKILGHLLSEVLQPIEYFEQEFTENAQLIESGQMKFIAAHPWIDLHCVQHWLETTKIPFDDHGEMALLDISSEITRRKENEDALVRRFDTERLISGVQSIFVNYMGLHRFEQVPRALQQIVRFFRIDGAFLVTYSPDKSSPQEWKSFPPLDEESLPAGFSAASRWSEKLLGPRASDTIYNVEIPIVVEEERLFWQTLHARSHYLRPLLVARKPMGVFGLFCSTPRAWTKEDHQLISMLGDIFTSLIDRIRTRDELARSEEKYRSLFDLAGDMIVTVKFPGGTIVDVNRQTLAHSGYPSEQLLGAPIARLTQPGTFPEVRRACLRQLREQDYFVIDTELQRPGLPIMPVEVLGKLLALPGERILLLIGRDITERREAELRKVKNLHEKEILLQELNHRVKNNLQLIVSLLNLQIGATDNAEVQAILNDHLSRIYSIAMIHQRLYNVKELAGISMQEYLDDLVHHLAAIYQDENCLLEVGVTANTVDMEIDQAIPCAMIVNELVSNAIKHAFKGRDHGRIEVSLRVDETGKYLLEVKDDGKGIAEDSSPDPNSLGLKLVRLLTRQMRGVVRIDHTEGTRYSISFNLVTKG